MKKQKSAAKPANAPVVLADLHEQTRQQYNRKDVQKFDAVAPNLLAAIIAVGIFDSNNEIVDDVVGVVAERRFKVDAYSDAIEAFSSKLEGLGVSMQLLDPIDKANKPLTELVFAYVYAYSQASYIVGVSVGRAMAGAK